MTAAPVLLRFLGSNEVAVVCGDDVRRIRLVPQQYRLLSHLAERAGRTVVTEDLVEFVCKWDPPKTAAKMMHVLVCKLRQDLAQHGCEAVIETVWGEGFRLNVAAYRVEHAEITKVDLRLQNDDMARLEQYAELTGENPDDAAASLVRDALDQWSFVAGKQAAGRA